MIRCNKKILAIGIAFVGLTILGIIATYAFFPAGKDGNKDATQTVIEKADLRLVFNDTEVITLDNGASTSKTFTVQNIGNADITYDIELVNVTNTFANDELIYTITSDNDGGTITEEAVPNADGTLISNIKVSVGITQTYTITIKFKETGKDQNANHGAKFSGVVSISLTNIPTLKEKILADNTAQSDESINFNSTNGNGLFYTADEKTYGEDEERTYYFRGVVDNNWVSFAGYLWRIVRTTSEGGVKLVYSGDGSSERSSFIDITINFNTNKNTKYHVGYTHNTDLNGYEGAQTNSDIKTFIDDWYNGESGIKDKEEYLSPNAIYCNDRSSEREEGGYIYYPASDRIGENTRPTFACPSANASRYTVSTETGNGYLSNPIALLTVDEINYAGVILGERSLDSYIMDNARYYMWTMSPSDFYSSFASMFCVSDWGYLRNIVVGDAIGIRPAVSLKSSVVFTGGNGSKSNPYTVE